ncbi:spore coat U domain-containing protein [Pantoea sp.]|uniref:Csu type fimbrial protein n=1 Tax=Pantoea sp. TaxID=69393 RepID=UPI0028974946|nr:spore coat U domain-containing protein [Pantoea sp.]
MRSLLLLALLSLFPLMSKAACPSPAATASFGTATTFVVNTTPSTTSTSIAVNCGAGSNLTLLGTDTIVFRLTGATVVSASRGIMKRSGDTGTDNIPVRLCVDSACATELQVNGASYTFSSASLLTLLVGSQLNFNLPVYLRTVPGQTIAAGTYNVTLNLSVTYNICTSINLLGLCLGGQTGTNVVPIAVSIIVSNDCTTITAPNVSFGSAPLVSSFSSVSQTISVVCSKGSTYTVGLSNGSYAAGSVRNMASGANRLSYEIYKGTSSDRWGPTGTERWSSTTSTSVSTDGLTRGYSYTARILANQNTPPAGNYSDSVVVDLAF